MSDFKIGPCAVIYQDEFLGICDDGLQFRGESTSQAATAQQFYAQTVDRTLTALNPTVTVEIIRTARAMQLLFGTDGLSLQHLGQRFSTQTAELKLIPLNPNDPTGYLIPCAAPDRSFQYQFKSSAPHTARIVFAILPDADGQLIRYIDAAPGRALIPQSSTTDIIALEKSLATHLATLLSLTIDQDIFCGEIPEHKYGCVAAVEGQITGKTWETNIYQANVTFYHPERTGVMMLMNSLMAELPQYGLDFAQTIQCTGQSFPEPAERGTVSHFSGRINLSIII